MKKIIVIAASVVLILAIAITVTVVFSLRGAISATEAHHDKTITSPEGKTANLDYSTTEDVGDGTTLEKYTDQEGNTYSYNKNGEFSGYLADDESYKDIYYRYINGEIDTVDEETAIAIASNVLSEMYGDYFYRMTLSEVTFREFDGSWRVAYAEMLGEGDFIEGIRCSAEIRADGSIDSTHLRGEELYADIGDKQLEGITYERIKTDIETAFSNRYGNKLDSYKISKIGLMPQDGHIVVYAGAWPRVCRDDGSVDYDEWPLFTYELND